VIRNRSDIEPVKGKPVKFGEMIIVPTYVRESEAPQPNGACLTHDYTDREIDPAGWYVEAHCVKSGGHDRMFIPFGALSEVPDESA
jgi:hypothetical protein